MEIPYQGRAVINEYFDGVEIVIPTKRNWFLVILLPVWLGVWLVAFIFVAAALFNSRDNWGAIPFIFFWLCAWTVGGFFAAATWWWNIAGKEIITVSQGVLTIVKKGAIAKTKAYELKEAKNFRAEEDFSDDFSFLRRRRRGQPWKVATEGTIHFDYGMQTVRFGDKLHKPEVDYILDRLRSKRLIN